MDCPACQHANPADSRFCGGCGASLATAVSCPDCGRPSAPGQKFCNGCGRPLAQAAASASREPRAYTPPHLADKILRSKAALEGERKQVTVLFADVKGSMDLAAQLDPEEWHQILDRFFQILAGGVHRFEGTVNQYTGDGIMALFGAPIAHEDHAQRACYAALHLTDALRDYAQELRREHGVDLSARIGLNSGEVVVGRIGDDLRMDYTAQGHTVGLAQRMEQLAEPGLPYASEHTARLVDGYFDLTDLGEFRVKGSATPVRALGIAGVGLLRTRLELSRARGFSTFVGRSEELVVLEAALGQALDGEGTVVGVVGDAGVGKSRLCHEFVERCRARGIAVYEGHCVSYGVAMPLLPILEMIRSFLEITDADTPLRVREKVTGRLLTLDESLREFLPLLFDLLGVPDPDDPPQATDSTDRERQLFTFTRRLIRARSNREPAVMLIDDTHWIDAGSDAVVAECVEVVPSTRTLFLLNFRPEYSAEWMSRSTYQQLPLRPLGDAAVTALLDELLGDDDSLGPLRETIRERTQGNPFYVEEVVRSLADSGALEGERGGYRLVMPIDRVDVPSTVQGILAARIDRLNEQAKTVLQYAAAIGRTFSGELLRHVCELPDEAVTGALAELRRAELIYEQSLYPEVEYAFRHPLTHEVAERSQLAAHRRQVHAALARVLEERAPAERGEHAALVAHHWDQAEEALPAALWHRRAAEWIGGANPSEAVRHWMRVRVLADTIDDEDVAAELGERSRRLIIEYVWRRGLPEEEAEALLEEAEAWARRRNDTHALAGFYDAYGTAAALSYGQIARARQLIDEGRRLARTAGDAALTFSLELRHAIISDYEGDLHKADAAARALLAFPAEEVEAASALVGYDAPAFVRVQLGIAAFEAGRIYEARIRIEDAVRFAKARGATEVAGWSLSVLADVLHTSGDVQAALRYARESMAIAEQLQSHLSVALAAVVLAEMLLGIGDLDGALAVGQRALAATEKTFRPYVPRALAALAMVQLGRDDVAEARTLAERAVRTADDFGLLDARVHAGITLLQVDIAGNDTEILRTAPERLNRFREELEHLGIGASVPRVLTTLAEVYDRLGDERAATGTRRELEALQAEMLAPTTVDLSHLPSVSRATGTRASTRAPKVG